MAAETGIQVQESSRRSGAQSSLVHRVGFHETDAMGIVHHANYLKLFEDARVVWLDEHDLGYLHYMGLGLHFAVTHVEVDYKQSARFDDRLEVTTWMDWVGGASLRMSYCIQRGDDILVTGATEHAAVNDEGRVRRIPKDDRVRLASHAMER
jgi:acyl-CoA thioester hydrolase